MRTIALTSAALIAAPLAQAAGSFETAKITFIQKDVSVADLKILKADSSGGIQRREAALNETVGKDNAVVTGEKSRAELEFNDGTLTRLGQLTAFTFTEGTRKLQVKQGTALFVVPKGLGGTTIQAGPVTAAITGTTLLVQILGDRVLIFVYEGSVQVGGETVTTGQVASVAGGTTTVNKFDVNKGVKTAALFTKFIDSPSFEVVQKELATALALPGASEGIKADVIDNAVLNPMVEKHESSYDSGYQGSGGNGY